MSKNPYGVGPASKEWGSKARKHEVRERNLNHQADAVAVAEGVAAMQPDVIDAAEALAYKEDLDAAYDLWLEERYEDLYAGTAADDDTYYADDFWYD